MHVRVSLQGLVGLRGRSRSAVTLPARPRQQLRQPDFAAGRGVGAIHEEEGDRRRRSLDRPVPRGLPSTTAPSSADAPPGAMYSADPLAGGKPSASTSAQQGAGSRFLTINHTPGALSCQRAGARRVSPKACEASKSPVASGGNPPREEHAHRVAESTGLARGGSRAVLILASLERMLQGQGPSGFADDEEDSRTACGSDCPSLSSERPPTAASWTSTVRSSSASVPRTGSRSFVPVPRTST